MSFRPEEIKSGLFNSTANLELSAYYLIERGNNAERRNKYRLGLEQSNFWVIKAALAGFTPQEIVEAQINGG